MTIRDEGTPDEGVATTPLTTRLNVVAVALLMVTIIPTLIETDGGMVARGHHRLDEKVRENMTPVAFTAGTPDVTLLDFQKETLVTGETITPIAAAVATAEVIRPLLHLQEKEMLVAEEMMTPVAAAAATEVIRPLLHRQEKGTLVAEETMNPIAAVASAAATDTIRPLPHRQVREMLVAQGTMTMIAAAAVVVVVGTAGTIHLREKEMEGATPPVSAIPFMKGTIIPVTLTGHPLALNL